MSKKDELIEPSGALLAELRGMIAEAREQVAQLANAALTMLYWQIGKRISRDILGEKRADYGKQIVASLGRQLATEFGAGFGEKNLHRMIPLRNADVFSSALICEYLRHLRFYKSLSLETGEALSTRLKQLGV